MKGGEVTRLATERGNHASRHLADLPTTEFGVRSARAATVKLGSQAAIFLLNLGTSAALARLLSPNDFGLVAMSWTLVSFLSVFKDFGLTMATVHKDRITQAQLSALFWVNAALCAGLGLLTLLLGPAVAAFYSEQRLLSIFGLMAVLFASVGLGAQHDAILKRQMRFSALSAIEFGSTAAGAGVAISLAWWGSGYWALALQLPVSGVVRTVALWMTCRWSPDWPRWGHGVGAMVAYGGDVTVFRVISHIGKHLDRILIAYFNGAGPLGLYSAAERWAMTPIQQIYTTLLPVAVSGFSRLREDTTRYRRTFRAAMQPIFTVVLPTLAFLLIESRVTILVLLGEQWLEGIPIFRALLFGAVASSLSQFTKWIYLAEGQTRRQLHWVLVSTPILVIAVSIGVRWGAFGVAVAYGAACCALAWPDVAYCLKTSPLRPSDLLGAVWRPVLTTLGSTAALVLVRPVLSHGLVILELATKLVAFGGFFALFWVGLPGGLQSFAEMQRVLKLGLSTPRPGKKATKHGTTAANGIGTDPGSEGGG